MAKYLLDTNICVFFLRGKTQIEEWASQKSILRKKGELIDDLDLFIGATAIVNNMILVTDNEKHLNRLTNIKIENWIKS